MLCLATLVMVGLSWPLWLDGADFPRVPFLRRWPGAPAWCSRAALAAILGTLALASTGRGWRWALSVGLILIGVEVLGDQSRLQPWAYQFGLVGFGLVVAPGARSLRLARIYAISLYAYSGLSKLDASFLRELGPTFLAAGLAPLGISPAGWPRGFEVAAILAMPAWEVAVAAGLCSVRWRRLALGGAVVQHAALLAILGPWGLGHSPNVLVWNAAMIVEDCLLFWPAPAPASGRSWAGRVAGVVVLGVAAIWPAVERLGLCDSWPGHALYASHSERVEIFVPEEDAGRFPGPIRRRLGPADFGGWRRLDLTGWSRDIRGVPVYPQARVGLGIAHGLGALPGGSRPVRVVLWGRANARDGRRSRDECLGPAAIARQAERSWINALAASPPAPDRSAKVGD